MDGSGLSMPEVGLTILTWWQANLLRKHYPKTHNVIISEQMRFKKNSHVGILTIHRLLINCRLRF